MDNYTKIGVGLWTLTTIGQYVKWNMISCFHSHFCLTYAHTQNGLLPKSDFGIEI